ncbi:MAG: penicillin-binding protein 2 [Bacteroidales bacterium]|nr:penicillin-binding protein 2 [Bacteroidales bacterium]
MNGRFKFIIFMIFICGALILGRLFQLQIINHDFNSPVSNEQIAPASRGRIFIREKEDLFPLALNLSQYQLIVDPQLIIEADKVTEVAEKIAPFLNIEIGDQSQFIEEDSRSEDFKDLLSQISRKDDHYELLRKDLTAQEFEEIKFFNLPGVFFESVSKRYYPEAEFFGHLTGFTRIIDERQQGQYGLEEFFDQDLTGIDGRRVKELSSLPIYRTIKKAQPGVDIVLTIDRALQFFVCNLLEESIDKYQADSGSIILLSPKTGAILALANYPYFNPNEYFNVQDLSLFKNSSISDSFEPGSIFKVITMAGALDSETVTPNSLFTDTGFVKIDGETIHNVDDENFGIVTMTEILEESINTGAVYIANSLGRESFRNYLKKFGFGGLTDIELSGEESGNIDNLEREQSIYLATASFGQGISVTPLQMVTAVSAIANSGQLMKPYIVSEIIEKEIVTKRNPKVIRNVISPSAAAMLSAMMVSVVESGYGSRAKVKGYLIAGKTGTAQVPQSIGGYSDEVIHSFVGFAPATDPQFVALVKLDNPQKERFAASTSASVFGELAEFVLKYYNIPPDKALEH